MQGMQIERGGGLIHGWILDVSIFLGGGGLYYLIYGVLRYGFKTIFLYISLIYLIVWKPPSLFIIRIHLPRRAFQFSLKWPRGWGPGKKLRKVT